MIKSERESSRFVQQKSYYLSKYCLKRYVLRLVLKAGREGLWRREKEKEFQIWAAEKHLHVAAFRTSALQCWFAFDRRSVTWLCIYEVDVFVVQHSALHLHGSASRHNMRSVGEPGPSTHTT